MKGKTFSYQFSRNYCMTASRCYYSCDIYIRYIVILLCTVAYNVLATAAALIIPVIITQVSKAGIPGIQSLIKLDISMNVRISICMLFVCHNIFLNIWELFKQSVSCFFFSKCTLRISQEKLLTINSIILIFHS